MKVRCAPEYYFFFVPKRLIGAPYFIGQVFNFSVQYSVAKDYPADLYFLMDVSISMEDDKKNLVKLGEKLVETMRNMTADFQIGYGSFVDKNAVPFVKWSFSVRLFMSIRK